MAVPTATKRRKESPDPSPGLVPPSVPLDELVTKVNMYMFCVERAQILMLILVIWEHECS